MKEQDEATRLKRREPDQGRRDAIFQNLVTGGEDTSTHKEVIAKRRSSPLNKTPSSRNLSEKRDTISQKCDTAPAILDAEPRLQKATQARNAETFRVLSSHGQTSGYPSVEAFSD